MPTNFKRTLTPNLGSMWVQPPAWNPYNIPTTAVDGQLGGRSGMNPAQIGTRSTANLTGANNSVGVNQANYTNRKIKPVTGIGVNTADERKLRAVAKGGVGSAYGGTSVARIRRGYLTNRSLHTKSIQGTGTSTTTTIMDDTGGDGGDGGGGGWRKPRRSGRGGGRKGSYSKNEESVMNWRIATG